jgi:hypothetical protein
MFDVECLMLVQPNIQHQAFNTTSKIKRLLQAEFLPAI